MRIRSIRWTKPGVVALLVAGATAASLVHAGEITLFERDGFGGRSVSTSQTVSNLAEAGFNGRASSARVKSGSWQLCTEAYFRGRCVTVKAGDYPRLAAMQLQYEVASAREMDWLGERAPPAPPARVQLFDALEFGGQPFAVDAAINNFADVGFNDRALSMIVRDGTWQVCEHAEFRGVCRTYRPGRYAELGDLGWKISSIRPTGRGPAAPAPPASVGGPQRGRVELFDGAQLDGRSFALDTAIGNFAEYGYNDRAQSMIVRDGVWEACQNADYRGICQTFGPGRYVNLGALAGRISSMRPVVTDADQGGWGSGARAVLYESPNLSGRSFVINGEVVANLDKTGFNDRAGSMRVEGGYWIFCSDADFGGECRTFAPGDYATLPQELNHKISSGRRIQSSYPYRQSPSWPR